MFNTANVPFSGRTRKRAREDDDSLDDKRSPSRRPPALRKSIAEATRPLTMTHGLMRAARLSHTPVGGDSVQVRRVSSWDGLVRVADPKSPMDSTKLELDIRIQSLTQYRFFLKALPRCLPRVVSLRVQGKVTEKIPQSMRIVFNTVKVTHSDTLTRLHWDMGADCAEFPFRPSRLPSLRYIAAHMAHILCFTSAIWETVTEVKALAHPARLKRSESYNEVHSPSNFSARFPALATLHLVNCLRDDQVPGITVNNTVRKVILNNTRDISWKRVDLELALQHMNSAHFDSIIVPRPASWMLESAAVVNHGYAGISPRGLASLSLLRHHGQSRAVLRRVKCPGSVDPETSPTWKFDELCDGFFGTFCRTTKYFNCVVALTLSNILLREEFMALEQLTPASTKELQELTIVLTDCIPSQGQVDIFIDNTFRWSFCKSLRRLRLVSEAPDVVQSDDLSALKIEGQRTVSVPEMTRFMKRIIGATARGSFTLRIVGIDFDIGWKAGLALLESERSLTRYY